MFLYGHIDNNKEKMLFYALISTGLSSTNIFRFLGGNGLLAKNVIPPLPYCLLNCIFPVSLLFWLSCFICSSLKPFMKSKFNWEEWKKIRITLLIFLLTLYCFSLTVGTK